MSAPATDAIVFDFDGVLAETAAIKVAAFTEIYAEHGTGVVGRVVAHHLANEGISRIEKMRTYHREFLGVDLDDAEVEALGARFTALVEDAVVAAPWVAGARAVLDSHAGRTPMFVVSGTPEGEIRRIVARRGMDGYFAAVRGSPPRKAPILRELLAGHGLAPGRVLFVGDARADFEAAETTGIRFVGRVDPGCESPFPPGTPTIPDLTALAA